MRSFLSLTLVILFNTLIFTQIPFNTTPTWISTDGDYSTGCAWADINRDGWQDLVISNGNDMARQRVVVYLNNNGTFQTTPQWQSADIDYHGHLSAGDINNDGWTDVAVSVYIGPSGFSSPGKLKVYMNNNGTLGTSPSWQSQDLFYTFSCALGDADGDGDLDLAAATGESYNNKAHKKRIYINNNGILSNTPGWYSNDSGYSMDVAFADFNNDHKLDVVFAGESGPNKIYYSYGDSIATIPSWSSTDPGIIANSLFTGDINNDGFIDLVVSDNNQLGGTGKLKIYTNNNGILNTTPIWQSAFSGYGSGVALADVDYDYDADLISGAWWSNLRLYYNNASTFTTTPNWTSVTNSVVEAIAFGDYDKDGIDSVTYLFLDSTFLLYCSKPPLHKIISIINEDDTLNNSEYCYDLENGWISIKKTVPISSFILVKTLRSRDLDFAISNWDVSVGNYIFKNNTNPSGVSVINKIPATFKLYQNYPNPFNPSTKIRFDINNRNVNTPTSLKIYNTLGQITDILINEELDNGEYEVNWNSTGHPSGVYFYVLISGSYKETKKMILIR